MGRVRQRPTGRSETSCRTKVGLMFRSLTRSTVIGLWLAALVVLAAVGVFSGVALTLDNGALWLVACLAPPSVMLMVWRGAPPPTVAEILYAVDKRD
jgi:hypothetical protein